MKKILKPKKLLLIIFLLGFWLRVVGLDRNPIELFGDEIDVGLQAFSLWKTGRDYKGHLLPAYLQSFSEWRAPFLMYATAPFVAVFGLNEWGVRLPSAFFGSLTILLVYWLVLRLSKKEKLSLLAAFFLTVSPWHIQYSRAAFEVALMLFLIGGGVLLFLKAKEKEDSKKAVGAGVLMAAALYTYNTANIFGPLFLVFLSGFLPPAKKFWPKLWPGKKNSVVAIFWLVFLIALVPLGKNIFFGEAATRFEKFSVFGSQEILDKIQQMRSFYPGINPLLTRLFYNRPCQWAKRILENYVTAFSPRFLFIHGDVTFRHSLHELGQLYWFQLPLILAGIFEALKKFRQKENLFWLVWLILAPLPASLTIDGAYHATRLILMVIPLCYFSAKGGLALIEKINPKKLKLVVFLSGLIFLTEFLHYQNYYWHYYPTDSWRWWHNGYKEAMESLILREGDFDQVRIETTYEPALPRYLFWKADDPKKIWGVDDQLKEGAVDGLGGFCLDKKVCFVDFGGGVKEEQIKEKTLYLISQERNVGGDWDWSKSPPPWAEVLETIRNPKGEMLFYLIRKKT